MKPIKNQKNSTHYVYMILCENGSYYTGYTTDPERRMAQHKAGKGAKYTRILKPVKMMVLYTYQTKQEAMRKEYEIKQLTHIQKHTIFEVAKVAQKQKIKKLIALKAIIDYTDKNLK